MTTLGRKQGQVSEDLDTAMNSMKVHGPQVGKACIILNCIILHSTILTIPYHTILYYIISYYLKLHVIFNVKAS